MAKFARKPTLTQLFFRCQYCQKEWQWPQNKARQYCNSTCRNAYNYRIKKAKRQKKEQLLKETPNNPNIN